MMSPIWGQRAWYTNHQTWVFLCWTLLLTLEGGREVTWMEGLAAELADCVEAEELTRGC